MADSQKYGRTANLFDDEIESGFYNDNGELVSDTTTSHSTTYIPVDGTTYTISGLWTSTTNFAVYEWDTNKNWLRRSNRQVPASSTLTFSIGSDTAFFTLQIKTEHGNIMLNTGSTALPYQPYNDWVHSLRKLTTATEAVENPLYSDGSAITAYTIKGNTVQSGTPTPSNPVDVNGVGELTANLWGDTLEQGTISSSTGQPSSADNRVRSKNGLRLATGTYTIATDSGKSVSARIYNIDGTYNRSGGFSGNPVSFSLDDEYLVKFIIQYANDSNLSPSDVQQIMLNTGSTALPYEPYGYEIPISSGGVTTDIELGSTQTVRQIYKIVLTPNMINTTDVQGVKRALINLPYTGIGGTNAAVYCTHYLYNFGYDDNTIYVGRGNPNLLYINDNTHATSATDYGDWLTAQAAANTPVTVWYVLATPQTAAVNEPLMKIDTYADNLSNAVAIPTTEGANSITVDTTVQPSEFTATWTGWHDASVKEWDGSDWQ